MVLGTRLLTETKYDFSQSHVEIRLITSVPQLCSRVPSSVVKCLAVEFGTCRRLQSIIPCLAATLNAVTVIGAGHVPKEPPTPSRLRARRMV
jgi:hypothetical protein